jgi:5'-nucleotidase / UDP-sugar diphosphatase
MSDLETKQQDSSSTSDISFETVRIHHGEIMNTRAQVLLFCLLLAAATAVGQIDTIIILHVNDTHGNLSTIGPRNAGLVGSLGGIARAASLIGGERMANPNALLLHAGDFSIGDLFYNKYFGVTELRLMVALGFDALTLGNHEFDLTPPTLLKALDSGFVGGGFPVLSANLLLPDASVQPLKKYVSPFTVKQAGNMKVGIFGLTTPATNLLSQPGPAVLDTNIIPIAARMVDSLKARNCTVIICLSHLGLPLDELVGRYVPGIHVIMGGHDHYSLAKPRLVTNPTGDTTLILQANAFYLDLGKLRLTVEGNRVRMLDYSLFPITSSIPEEPTIAANVTAMIADIEGVYGPVYTQKMATVTAFCDEVADSLMFQGKHDTPVGNLVTDAFRAATGTQIAFEVGGSTAEPLYPGPIVSADAFRVVGYGFNTVNGLGYRIATFTMTGTALLSGLEYGLSGIEADDEFLIQASGLTYVYNSGLPPLGRLVSAKVNGVPVDPSATYSVTANEFAPMFLTQLGIPFSNLHVSNDTTEFQVLAGYCAQLGSITPGVEGRVVNVVTPTAAPSEHKQRPHEW